MKKQKSPTLIVQQALWDQINEKIKTLEAKVRAKNNALRELCTCDNRAALCPACKYRNGE